VVESGVVDEAGTVEEPAERLELLLAAGPDLQWIIRRLVGDRQSYGLDLVTPRFGEDATATVNGPFPAHGAERSFEHGHVDEGALPGPVTAGESSVDRHRRDQCADGVGDREADP